MLSPDMILDNIRYGEQLEAKKEYFLAYWVYRYAESSVEREDEAICLIGSPEAFGEAGAIAGMHRRRVWKRLTEEEKEYARKGINPFGLLPEYKDFKTPPFDYGWDDPCCYFYDDEDSVSDKPESKKSRKRHFSLVETILASIILLIYGRKSRRK